MLVTTKGWRAQCLSDTSEEKILDPPKPDVLNGRGQQPKVVILHCQPNVDPALSESKSAISNIYQALNNNLAESTSTSVSTRRNTP